MKVVFATNAWSDYLFWQTSDVKTLDRLNKLIEECRRHPFQGAGKPEPLKGDLSGWCSRRITSEHRLVYRVSERPGDQQIQIAQCRYHY